MAFPIIPKISKELDSSCRPTGRHILTIPSKNGDGRNVVGCSSLPIETIRERLRGKMPSRAMLGWRQQINRIVREALA